MRNQKTKKTPFGVLRFLLWGMPPFLMLSSAFAQMPFRPDHVVIVIEENKAFSDIIGQTDPNTGAPYINSLAAGGALFTNSYAIQHPSEPNYLHLFSGSNQGINDDSRPAAPFTTPNLGAELLAKGYTFGGYAETMPSVGYNGDLYTTVPGQYQYMRICNPWVNWQGASANAIPAAANMPFSLFPSDYAALPTVSFVVPNIQNDMHDGTIHQGDQWLKDHLDGYVQWAKTHNSLLIVTWDEDEFTPVNHIPTLFFGPMVRPGQYSETINHYNVLRTVEDLYGLGYAGASGSAAPLTDAFVPPHIMTWNKPLSGLWSDNQWTNSPPSFPNNTVDAVMNSVFKVTVDGSYTAHSLTISVGTIDIPATRSLTTLVGADISATGLLTVEGAFTSQMVRNNGDLNILSGGQASVSGILGTGKISVLGNSILTTDFIKQNSLTIGSVTATGSAATSADAFPSVPEPSSILLLIMSVCGFFAWRGARNGKSK